MSNLTLVNAGDLLDHLTGTATYTPALPYTLALVTVLGDASTAGTEVVGGSYARQTVAFGAESGGVAANTGTITFSDMPAVTVVGGELYDNAGVRRFTGPFSANITVNAGDDLVLDAGDLTLTVLAFA